MGILDVFRSSSGSALRRDAHAVALPYGVSDAELTRLVQQWAPDAARFGGRLALSRAHHVVGPVSGSEAGRLPKGMSVAYAVARRSEAPPDDAEWVVGDFAHGLAARLGGHVRPAGTRTWKAVLPGPSHLLVLAPRRLSSDGALRALAWPRPGLKLSRTSEDGHYDLEGGGLSIGVSTAEDYCHNYPAVRVQPWFVSWERTTSYWIEEDITVDSEEGVRLARDAAHALAVATDGVVLDDNGFPLP